MTEPIGKGDSYTKFARLREDMSKKALIRFLDWCKGANILLMEDRSGELSELSDTPTQLVDYYVEQMRDKSNAQVQSPTTASIEAYQRAAATVTPCHECGRGKD